MHRKHKQHCVRRRQQFDTVSHWAATDIALETLPHAGNQRFLSVAVTCNKRHRIL